MKEVLEERQKGMLCGHKPRRDDDWLVLRMNLKRASRRFSVFHAQCATTYTRSDGQTRDGGRGDTATNEEVRPKEGVPTSHETTLRIQPQTSGMAGYPWSESGATTIMPTNTLTMGRGKFVRLSPEIGQLFLGERAEKKKEKILSTMAKAQRPGASKQTTVSDKREVAHVAAHPTLIYVTHHVTQAQVT